MERVWDVLRPVSQIPGWPWSLVSTANAWAQNVAAPVSAQAGTAQVGSLDTDNNWAGDAADRYREILPQQQAAIAAIKTQFADAVRSSMYKMTGGIAVFWAATVVAIGRLIGAIVAAAAETATVVGAPAAPPTAAVGALVFLGTMAGGLATLVAVAFTAKSDLVGATIDFTAYGGGRWPRAELM